jgi:hypothetical protein
VHLNCQPFVIAQYWNKFKQDTALFAARFQFFAALSHTMVQLRGAEKNAAETSFFRPSNCASIGNVHKRFSWRLAAVSPIDRSIGKRPFPTNTNAKISALFKADVSVFGNAVAFGSDWLRERSVRN